MSMAKIGVISLGCAKNQVNCEQMMYRLQEAGHEILPDVTGADVVLINTCGFIDSAKSEAIDHIIAMGQLKEAGVVGKILVTGCLSQRYQKEILEEMPEVDGLLGTGSYGDVVPAVEALLEGKPVASFGDIHQPEVETGRVLTTPQHYAYLKIAEGCDNHCAYCVIPSLRGRYRSRQMDDVLYEARNLAADGVKELIVVAQDTSRYGTDLPGHKRLLAELLRQLCRIDGIHWVRVHYLYPDEIDEELMEVLAEEPKIVKYLDIPIQHFHDGILRRMNRRGAADQPHHRPSRRGRRGICPVVPVPETGEAGTGRGLPLFPGGGDPGGSHGAPGRRDGPGPGGNHRGTPVPDYGSVQRIPFGKDPGGPLRRIRPGGGPVLRKNLRRFPGH